MITPTRGAQRQTLTCTVLNGATVSNAVQLGDLGILCGLFTPAAWTSSTVSFQASNDGVTFGAVSDINGAILSGSLGASAFLALDPSVFSPWSYIKVVSTTSQGADRIVSLVVRIFA